MKAVIKTKKPALWPWPLRSFGSPGQWSCSTPLLWNAWHLNLVTSSAPADCSWGRSYGHIVTVNVIFRSHFCSTLLQSMCWSSHLSSCCPPRSDTTWSGCTNIKAALKIHVLFPAFSFNAFKDSKSLFLEPNNLLVAVGEDTCNNQQWSGK